MILLLSDFVSELADFEAGLPVKIVTVSGSHLFPLYTIHVNDATSTQNGDLLILIDLKVQA